MRREMYLEKLMEFKDTKLIKVITGIRRCGKSTLLFQFQEQLKSDGILDEQIVSINLEELEFEDLLEYHQLYNYIMQRQIKNKKMYIFIDEIQLIPDFQKALDSLYVKENMDIYVTGSNAVIFSGELATRLSGRYVEFNMFTYSFAEYMENKNISDLRVGLIEYIKNGGFPYATEISNRTVYKEYLKGIYNTVILKDIVERLGSSNVLIMESIFKYICDTVGNLITPKKIADTLTSMNRKTNGVSVEKYLRAMEDSYLFYKVDRYNISGKQWLKQQSKYYLSDLALRSILKEYDGSDIGHLLENVVAIELIRRGYRIFVGQLNGKEIDFVVQNQDEIFYVQVSQSVVEKEVMEREISPLLSIKDAYPKYLFTMDNMP
ncbi:MAG: ATP-binding protein, partial [Lachnospiraceae bacterium]|nr:ATP-binding protein [Lachnospiraceae bacterium]